MGATRTGDIETLDHREPVTRARAKLERQQAAETRSFGGRRIGLVTNEEEHARRVELERRLLELARRAVRQSN